MIRENKDVIYEGLSPRTKPLPRYFLYGGWVIECISVIHRTANTHNLGFTIRQVSGNQKLYVKDPCIVDLTGTELTWPTKFIEKWYDSIEEAVADNFTELL